MYAKLCVLLLGVSLSYAAVAPKVNPSLGLMEYMMRTDASTFDNPQRSLSCISYYVPILNDISAQYEKDYALCLQEADSDRLNINNKWAPQRDSIDGLANQACNALSVCGKEDDSIDYFTCYSKAGAENSKVLYNISADSSEYLAQVIEEYRLVEVNEFACTNKSQRIFVENTATTIEDMDNCVKGLATVPTQTDAPPSTSTEAPVTSSPAEPEVPSSSPAEPEESSSSTAEPEEPSSSPAEPEESSSAEPEVPSSTPAEPEESSSSEPISTSTSIEPESKEHSPEEDLQSIFDSWLNNMRKKLQRS